MSHFFLSLKTSINNFKIRGVARGGQRDRAPSPPEFGRSVNPIQTRVGMFCPSHYCQPPRFQKAIYTSDDDRPLDYRIGYGIIEYFVHVKTRRTNGLKLRIVAS